MKGLFFALALLFSVSAHAAYDTSDYNCSELQSVLARNGQISVKRLFGSTTYYATPQCRGNEEVRAHYEWAKDTRSCKLGWDCLPTGF